MTARELGSASDVDAVVVTWNSAPDLDSCLAALGHDARAIVVDNGSTDDSVRVARAHGAGVIEVGRNLGFPAAVNRGLTAVAAPFTLLLNPDVVVGPGAIAACVAVLLTDPSVGMAGANVRLPDGRAEPPAARRDRTAAQILVESLGLVHLSRRFDRQMIHDRSKDRYVDAINGAFMLIRTDLLLSLDGVDDTVFMYMEDQDLCHRVRAAGSRIRFVAGAQAVHGGGTSTARGTSQEQVRAYLHRIDADVELLRRYGRKGESAAAILAYVLRSLLGLVVSVVRPARQQRYRSALSYSLQQIGGRRPPPPV